MKDTVIKVENLTKIYPLYKRQRYRFLEAIHPFGRKFHSDFFALNDVSFELKKGDSLAILGQNGSGKSSLLKIIAGVLSQTSGRVQTKGRIASLLELGAGFNPELTGIENVIFFGLINGMNESDVRKRINEILDFADIGEFAEQPVKTYSSGMFVRLAFSCAINVDPEILIIDEALAVGDAPFVAKCYAKLNSLMKNDLTLLFTTHDINSARSICKNALWLERGGLKLYGEAGKVTSEYEKFTWSLSGVWIGNDFKTDFNETQEAGIEKNGVQDLNINSPGINALNLKQFKSFTRYGNLDAEIINVLLTDSDGQIKTKYDYSEKLIINFFIRLNQDISSDFVAGFRIKSIQQEFFLSAQDLEKVHRMEGRKGTVYSFRTEIPLNLKKGQYELLFGIFGFQEGTAFENGKYQFSRSVIWDIIEHGLIFEVRPHPVMDVAGPVHLHSELVYKEFINEKN